MQKEKATNVATNGHSDDRNAPDTKVARTTIFLTDVLSENLDALTLTTGLPKGEHVRRALKEYISQQGLNPDKKPKIKVSY